jgi:hypothetical protein
MQPVSKTDLQRFATHALTEHVDSPRGRLGRAHRCRRQRTAAAGSRRLIVPVSESATVLPTIPDDCQLVSVTACAAAFGVSERKAKAILAAESIPMVELGARSCGVRLSHVRRLLTSRERPVCAADPAGRGRS